MPKYPYADGGYPQDDLHLNYMLDYNTRFVSGTPSASYYFHYQTDKPVKHQ
jgi:hypothetical protein